MARNNDDARRPQQDEIDKQKAREEHAQPEELREINEGRGDGGNPSWWKNEGGSGEVH